MSGFTLINVGATANDGTGDSLRVSQQAVNSNFLTATRSLSLVTDLASEAAASGYTRIVQDLDRGGIFKAVNGGTANNGNIFASATSGWTWQRLFKGPVFPLWFGAVGDGVTDDTSVIQSMLNLLGTDFSEIDFGDTSYSYLISRQAVNYCARIQSKSNFVLRGSGAKIKVRDNVASVDSFGLKLEACSNFEITGIDLDCEFSGVPASRQNSGALMIVDNGSTGCVDGRIYGNRIKSSHSAGSSGLVGNYGLYAYTDSNSATLTKNIDVYDNTFYDCDGRACQFLAVDGGSIVDNRFNNLGPNGGYFAIRLLNDCKDVIVKNNKGYDASDAVLTSSDAGIFIAAGSYGAAVGRNPSRITASENVFRQTRATAGGFNVYGAYISQVKDVGIFDNSFNYTYSSLVYTGYGIGVVDGVYYSAGSVTDGLNCIGNVLNGYQLSPERCTETGAVNVKFDNYFLDHSSLSGFYQIPFLDSSAESRNDQFNQIGKGFGGIVQNLLTYSEEVDNADWTKTNTTATVSGTNPVLTSKCNSLKETSDTGEHSISQGVTLTTGTTYVISARVKDDGRDVVEMVLPLSRFGSSLIGRFDLTNESSTIQGGNGSSRITPLANGWYSIHLAGYCTSSGSGDVLLRLYNSASSYAGDITKGVLVYGLQLNENGVISYARSAAEAVDYYGGAFGRVNSSRIDAERIYARELNVGDSDKQGIIGIDGPSGTARDYQIRTAGGVRWTIRATSGAESGSNAGSDLQIIARSDAGAVLSTPLAINRATGQLTIGDSGTATARIKHGLATLSSGTVTVSDSTITASTRIMLTTQAPSGTAGWLHVASRSNGVSFTVTSSSGSDNSVIAYALIEP
jgi:hypothetical protein